ncbi:MAG: exodeoxyribonuclease III [Acidobacteriota bacterium]|nr:exodeoxyribonuclease III [Acidobacteriota bacterium]MDE3031623.1 exodeoxyribonuclease III [Acidobacteriota bacterium]MDE3093534.1 exodeoxyribonuclease III [Acidobacteriota bacterium]MDE3138498.1 exodeoxyribonuclease III [Acidobacteriota bacterium]MDE3147137.1 exodeoxyribonuclease III [Acidobacteriota bacterium]
MKVATWNVNSLSARWPRVLEWLTRHEPDVVLLQETKQNDAKFPFAALASLGYDAAHHGQGQWNGVAIVARDPLSDVERGLGDDVEARFIAATCRGMRFYSCYVPNGRALDNPHYDYKLRWLASLRERLAARDRARPLIVGGDFNVALSDLDVYDPDAFVGATHVSPPERDALRALLDTDMVDLGRRFHPDEPAFTWWDYRNASFGRGWGLRIDYLLADVATAALVTDVRVDREARKGEKPSDHAPVVAELTW